MSGRRQHYHEASICGLPLLHLLLGFGPFLHTNDIVLNIKGISFRPGAHASDVQSQVHSTVHCYAPVSRWWQRSDFIMLHLSIFALEQKPAHSACNNSKDVPMNDLIEQVLCVVESKFTSRCNAMRVSFKWALFTKRRTSKLTDIDHVGLCEQYCVTRANVCVRENGRQLEYAW